MPRLVLEERFLRYLKMIDQCSSELNIIIGVKDADFETAIKAIYDIFVSAEM